MAASARLDDHRSAPRPAALHLLDKAADYVVQAWDRVSRGERVDCLDAAPLVREMCACLADDRAALCAAAGLNRPDGYEISHGVGVAVHSLAFGRAMGLGADVQMALGLAGLHHDLGKARLPAHLLARPGRLNPWELAQVRLHAQEGSRALRAGGRMRRLVAEAVLDHHERHDGSGYPRGIPGRAVSACGRVVALADAFDAMTADRSHQPAASPTAALGRMFKESGRQFDPGWTALFVRSLGVYPPGSLVRLSDGRLAVVRALNPRSPLQPLVMLLGDDTSAPGTSLDLSAAGLRVECCLEPGSMGIPAAALLLQVSGRA